MTALGGTEPAPPSGTGGRRVTLGPRGCAILSRDEGYQQLAAPVVEALDTTGAGDGFDGAFLHAFPEDELGRGLRPRRERGRRPESAKG